MRCCTSSAASLAALLATTWCTSCLALEAQALSAAAAGLRVLLQPGTKPADTIRAIDLNGNGMLDRTEILAFASNQGLNAEEFSADFLAMDTNGNGQLEAAEIAAALGSDNAEAAPAAGVAPVAAPAAAEAPPVAATQPATMAMVAAPAPELVPAKVEPAVPDLQGLETIAERQADNILAEVFAKRAQDLFTKSAEHKEKSAFFDNTALALRGALTGLEKKAARTARQAAREAATKVTSRAQKEVEELQQKVAEVDQKAAQRRAEARAASQRVLEVQAEIDASASSE